MDIKNLAAVSREEQLQFIKSFDRVLTDMDGVIWLAFVPLPDAQECIANFRRLGKPVHFITNLAARTRTVSWQALNKHNFDVKIDDIITPFIAVTHYLKKINFQKKIYVIATSSYKEELRKEGFRVAPDPPQEIEETISAIIKNIQDDEEIGAVVLDYDINVTALKLQKALTYLKREDCLFLTGAADKLAPVGPIGPVVANYYNTLTLTEVSGRKPIQLAKPSEHFTKFIIDQFNIKNPERVLFIGDTIIEDMLCAAKGGFQKLLVLSGTAKIEDIQNWKYPEDCKPIYYIENLTELNKIIKTIS